MTTMETLEQALREKSTVSAWLAPTGKIRIVHIDTLFRLVGAGEHSDLENALRTAVDDYKTGGKTSIDSKSIAGSLTASSELDRWLLNNNAFQISFENEKFVLVLLDDYGNDIESITNSSFRDCFDTAHKRAGEILRALKPKNRMTGNQKVLVSNHSVIRVGSPHEEDIIGGQACCRVCGFINDNDPLDPVIIKWHGDSFNQVECSICKEPCSALAAHLHQDKYIGDECCWDERLRTTQ